MSEQIVYLNGDFVPLSEARIPVLDRGFIFGDGIYEVVPVYAGRPFRLTQHLQRMARSLKAIGIDNPFDEAGWKGLVADLISRHPWTDQFVYMQITRGVAKRDHAFPKGIRPTVFAMSSEFIAPSREQREQGVAAITHADERWLHCDIKSVSLLGNVLAKQAAVEAGAAECLRFCNKDGMGALINASRSIIYAFDDPKYKTQFGDNWAKCIEQAAMDAKMELAKAKS